MGTGFREFPQLEVGVSPYLGFTLYLSVFRCFGWFEAVRGRLIGLKTWDRIVGIFLKFVGCLCGNFALKCMLDMKKTGNWPYDRSQNMGPNVDFFVDFLGQSVKPRN